MAPASQLVTRDRNEYLAIENQRHSPNTSNDQLGHWVSHCPIDCKSKSLECLTMCECCDQGWRRHLGYEGVLVES